MAIIITPEEKAQLEKENTLIRELPGASGSDQVNYHNPVTGQEILAPTDPYHMTRRLRQGWRLGPASTELKAKWLVREQELKEEDDQRQGAFEASGEHKVDLTAQADRFNGAVAAAVAQVLEQIGYDPDEKQITRGEKEEEAPTEVDHQSDFLQTVDSPTETDTKQSVSEESRPELHLVE